MLITAELKTTESYSPIPVGNGDLSLMVDFTGSNDISGDSYFLHRAGFRQQLTNALLFPFGKLTQNFSGRENEIVDWKQSLDTGNGLVSSEAVYKNGTILESKVFCHLAKNIIAFHKKRTNSIGGYTLSFECGKARRMHYTPIENGLEYFFDGIAEYRGTIRFYSDKQLRFAFENGVFSMSSPAEELDIFMVFDDEPFSSDFQSLLAESEALWKEFHAESFVDLPDPEIMKTYEVSQYHLRINQTRWSMPVGIFNTHFGGRYFAFDEFFCAHALASGGHFSLLKKIADFRYSNLQWAKYRACGYLHQKIADARWEWETLENQEEGSLCGHWQDHIFHMAHIAMTVWYYCIYSGDKTFQKEKALPILEGCAEFYMHQGIITYPDGSMIASKCTDFERFGPGRENAYLTTCGIMATLKIAAECYDLFQYRRDRAEEYRKAAESLRKTLPQNDKLYFAVPDNDQKSVAVLGGIYPYDNVMGLDDPKQKNSIYDFMQNDATFGSMYPHMAGKKICRWYASWESIVLSRLGDAENALACLTDHADKTGCFGQIYELYPNRLPWFATAEGIFLQAIHEFLMPNSEERKDSPASKMWQHYSFKLYSRTGKQVFFEK